MSAFIHSSKGKRLLVNGLALVTYGKEEPAPPPSVGDFYQGGYYVGDISISGQTYMLIMSEKSGEVTGLHWSTSNSITGATSQTDGLANMPYLVGAGFPAAEYCRNYTAHGYDDWYLPASSELVVTVPNWELLPPDQLVGTGSTSRAPSSYEVTSTTFRAVYAGSTYTGTFISLAKSSTSHFVRPYRRVLKP